MPRKHRYFEVTTPSGLTFTIHGDPQMDVETLAALQAVAEAAYLQFGFPEKRADGWPLCPHCGEDELWSGLQWNGEGERPPLIQYVAAGLKCYRCSWESDTWQAPWTPKEARQG